MTEEDRGKLMKTTTILAIAFGVGALAACNKSPTEQAAENVESNYENVAENLEASTSNAAENMQAAGENAASAITNQGKEKAEAVRNAGNAVTNNAQ
jgi:carbonic anhydrase